jgi:hypothetical protein
MYWRLLLLAVALAAALAGLVVGAIAWSGDAEEGVETARAQR